MANKNSFSLNKGDYKSHNDLMFSPMGAAFFIAPFVNAMVRSGAQEEKELVFNSMIKFKAFEQIPSTKRGHAFGEMERIVDQALRTCTNVKNRQTRAQDAGLEFLENMIEEQNLLQHKVLLFLLEPGQVDRNIAGLIANKFMAKYQRPCCILTRVSETETIIEDELEYIITKISYQGSARGYDASGITNFKDICAAAPGVIFAQGHQGAFGLGIDANEIDSFLEVTDAALANMSSEPSYFVDYIFNANNVDTDKILEIAKMNDY
jgi:single-stranded-DNA-specific exonuclease